MENGYMVIEENAYMCYQRNKYFIDLATAYDYYRKLKKDVNNVHLIQFQYIEE